jgi:ABC-2 type transport system ATP-binding protein
MIETRALSRVFGALRALDSVDLDLPAGRVVGLLGPNGAGKTTLLNIVTTLLAPSSGEASVDGVDVTHDPLEVRRRIGYVPEHGAVYEGLTADEFVEMAGVAHGLDLDLIRERVDRLFDHFELHEARHRRLGTFSKGMRRKVLVCAAVLHDPRVVLLDEPLDGLDVPSQDRVIALLRDLAGDGRGVLLSSHVLEQVSEICDHLVVLAEGRVVWQGDLVDLRARYEGLSVREIFRELTVGGETRATRLADLLGDAV